MQDIKVEVNGKIKSVSVDELRSLYRAKFINDESKFFIDGVEGRFDDVAIHKGSDGLPTLSFRSQGNSVPQSSEAVSSAPAARAKTSAPAPSVAVSSQTSSVPEPNVEGMISLDDLESEPQCVPNDNATNSPQSAFTSRRFGAPQGVPFKHSHPLRKKKFLVFLLVVAPVVLIAIGSVAFLTGKLVFNKEKMEIDGSFNTFVTKINPKYKGVDYKKLFETLEKSCTIEKDDFETTEQFIDRKKAFEELQKTKPLFDQVNLISTFAVPVRCEKVDGKYHFGGDPSSEIKYEADKQVLFLNLGQANITEESEYRHYRELNLNFIGEKSEYSGKDKLGVDQKVTKIHGEDYVLYYYYGYGSVSEDERAFNYVSISGISPEEARNLVESLSVLVVFNVGFHDSETSARTTYFEHKTVDPTMLIPLEIDLVHHAIFVNNLEIWFYNNKTGEIVEKFSDYDICKNASKPYNRKVTTESEKSDNGKQTISAESEVLSTDVSISPEPIPSVDENAPVEINNGVEENLSNMDATTPKGDTAESSTNQPKTDVAAEETKTQTIKQEEEEFSETEDFEDFDEPQTASTSAEEEVSKAELDAWVKNSENSGKDASKDDESNSTGSEEPFDETLTKVPANFRGVDLGNLYWAVHDFFDLSKGTYETSKEHQERVDTFVGEFANKKILGNITFSSRIVFNTRDPKNGSIYPKIDANEYDADTETLSFSFKSATGISALSCKSNERFWRMQNDIKSDVYTGQNLYGVEKEIKKLTGAEYGLLIEPSKWPRVDEDKYKARLSGVSPQVAKCLASNAEALVIFSVDVKLNEKGLTSVAKDYTASKPTMDFPYDTSISEYAIYAKDVELWFYDKESGVILGKYSLDEYRRGVVKPYGDAMKIDETVPEEYSNEPVNPDAVSLPQDFIGHSYEGVAGGLVNLTLKDKDSTLYGKLKRSSTLSYLIVDKETGSKELPVEYDSSRSELTVLCNSIYFDMFEPSGNSYSSNGLVSLDIRDTRGESSAWTRQLAICNLMTDVHRSFYLSATIKNVNASQAKELKEATRALMVFKIADASSIDSFSNKFIELVSRKTCIYVDNVEFWFFNGKTGEIFSKFTLREVLGAKSKRYGDLKITNVYSGMNKFTVVGDKLDFAKNALGPKTKRSSKIENDGDSKGGKSDKQVGESEKEAPPLPSWDQLFAESSDEEEAWEKKKPTITVPGDAATLDEAVQKAQPGDVILLKSGQPRPFALGGKRKSSSDVDGVRVDKSIAIIGETGNAQDIIVSVETNESVVIDSKGVHFKGIFFKSANGRRDRQAQPMVSVESGSAQFKYCDFSGEKNVDTFGIRAKGPKSTAKCWKCNFTSYDKRAVFATEGGKATCEYCRFEKSDESVSTFDDGVAELTRCLFSNNGVAFVADGGGGGFLKENYFESNKGDWSISMGSSDKVKLFGNVSEGKATRDNFTPEEE